EWARTCPNRRVNPQYSIHVLTSPRNCPQRSKTMTSEIRELLAIKLTLEEWRHWLEGSQHLFEVVTNHKNLQYLRDAKCLNPRQARWALFFTRFCFTVTYRPGHKNLKADALSRLHQPDPAPEEPEPILPPAVFMCPIQWDLDDQIRAATISEPAPPGGPEGKCYVPTTIRLTLLDSFHTSPGSGHPGSQTNPLTSLKPLLVAQHGMSPATSRVVWSAPLHLHHSHLAMDFATDLPPSQGLATILVVTDCFSKACKLIPLKGLPTALKTAEALFHHVFRHFGIPEDIISDRGPQFIYRVWRGFFHLLGVSLSLSSGYHPQTNYQPKRKVQENGRYLWAYCHKHQDSWSQFLPWAEYAQNSLSQETTGLTPFQCILRYQPPLFPWTGELTEVPVVDCWFRESGRSWDSAHVHLQRAVRRHKDYADAESPPSKQINDVTQELTLPEHYRIAPTFHVSLLKPFVNPLLSPSTEHETPPPPEVDTNETIYR
ncbi:hypothetical protein M9458_018359, partial [Cirrhinus mrigala]